MNAIATEKIVTIGTLLFPLKVLHSTTIAYIQVLMRPYAEIIDNTFNIGALKDWISRNFLLQTTIVMHDKIHDTINRIAAEDGAVNPLNHVKTMIIEYILSKIILSAGEHVSSFPTDETILPWDVQYGIGHDGDFTLPFGITEEVNTLPVTVTIGDQQFQHMLSLEFTCGLLLFLVGKPDKYQITMFGVPFTTNYFGEAVDPLSEFEDVPVNFEDTRFNFEDDGEYDGVESYTVKIGSLNITFDSPDFMQGFITGAMWGGIDPHAYWSNLMTHTWNDHGDPVNTPLTF